MTAEYEDHAGETKFAMGPGLTHRHFGKGAMPTGIEWMDETWNPMTGCTKISDGCDHCYAHTVAHTKTRAAYLRQLPVVDTSPNRLDPFAPRF